VTDFERFAKALALTESTDNPRAWGDEGLACGRWQIHPAWLDTYWPDDIGVAWSWDQLFRAALLRFWGEMRTKALSPEIMAMTFHLGHVPIPPGDWDEKYGERFANWYAKLGLPAKPAKEG
jgi:hypothetical protein